MRFGSVCSGIEAASVAFSPLGWEAAWLAEVDVAASAVLAHRLGATAPVYPLLGTENAMRKIAWRNAVTNWGDMTVLPGLVRAGDAEAPDLLCGGTPCTAFSVAGLRGGLEDPRGQLTLSFVELANAIDDKRAERGQRPCVIFWENVPGVRSDKGNAFGHFLAALVGVENPIEPGPRPEPGRTSAHWSWKKEAGEHIPRWPSAGAVAGPRRTVAWRSSDAQYFGLAQRRERVFVVGSAREGFDPQAVLFEFDGVRRDSAPSREAWEDVAGTLAARTDGGGRGVERTGDTRGQDPVVACERPRPSGVIAMAHGQGGAEISEDRCPTLTCNHEAPIAAYGVALRGRDGGGTAELGDDLAGTLRASGGGGDKPHVLCVHGTQDPIVGIEYAHALGRNSGQENVVCVTGDITHTLRAEGFDAIEDGTGRGQPIIAFSCKDYGNDATLDLSPTMRAMNHSGSHANAGGQLAVQADMAVRRLMPVECERLQGFPDGWTDVPVGNRGAADGPRYKQLGNSWAVPCVRWIGERIEAHVAELDAEIVEVEFDDALTTWLVAA